MPSPRDPALYSLIKRRVQKQFGRWSAYASGSLVQQYKKAYRDRYGARSSPYIGSKSRSDPLAVWFRENWTDIRTGRPCGGVKTGVYYPTCRPRGVYAQLSPSQKKRMVARKQRVKQGTASYRDIL